MVVGADADIAAGLGMVARPVGLERLDDLLLRPVDSVQVRLDGEASTLRDVNGSRRSTQLLAGCDDPGNPLAVWPAIENTGPTWKGYPSLK